MKKESTTKVKMLKSDEVSVFFRELSMLFESGIALGQALFIMSENAREAGATQMCEAIGEKIDDGNSLKDALASTEKFPEHALRMVDIGQTSGKLESVLSGLATFYDRKSSLQKTVKSVFTYPLIMIGVMFCVLSVLIVKVLPLFAAVFTTTGAKMPLLLNLVTSSGLFTAVIIGLLFLILLFLAIAFIGAGRGLAAGHDQRGPLGRLPFIRNIAQKTEAGNFAYGMSLLLSGGVTLDSAVEMTEDMAASSWSKDKIEIIKNAMEEGDTFATAVMKSNIMDNSFAALLAAGEKSGQTDSVMDLIADKYTTEIDDKISSALAVVEPTLVIIMSLIIGGILLSIMVPLMNIMASV